MAAAQARAPIQLFEPEPVSWILAVNPTSQFEPICLIVRLSQTQKECNHVSATPRLGCSQLRFQHAGVHIRTLTRAPCEGKEDSRTDWDCAAAHRGPGSPRRGAQPILLEAKPPPAGAIGSESAGSLSYRLKAAKTTIYSPTRSTPITNLCRAFSNRAAMDPLLYLM